jgi:hypothetical protein
MYPAEDSGVLIRNNCLASTTPHPPPPPPSPRVSSPLGRRKLSCLRLRQYCSSLTPSLLSITPSMLSARQNRSDWLIVV